MGFSGGFKTRNRLIQQGIREFFQPGIHPDADRVLRVGSFARVVNLGHPKAAVRANMNPHTRPRRTQAVNHILQILAGSQRRVRAAVQQAEVHNQIVFCAGDQAGQILILIVVSVKKDELLLAVRGIIKSIDVQGEVRRRFLERGNELIDEHVPQAKEGARANGVLKAGQGGLTCQVIILNGTITDQLEDRIAPQHVVVVLIWVVGQDAVNPHPCHFEERVIDVPNMAPIDQGLCELSGEPDLLVEFPERQQPAVTGNLSRRGLYHNRLGRAKIKGDLKNSLRIHLEPPCCSRSRVFSNTSIRKEAQEFPTL